MKQYLNVDLDLSKAEHREYLKLFTKKLDTDLKRYKSDQDCISTFGPGSSKAFNWEMLGFWTCAIFSALFLLSAIEHLGKGDFGSLLASVFIGSVLALFAHLLFKNRHNSKKRVGLSRAEKAEKRITEAINSFKAFHPVPA